MIDLFELYQSFISYVNTFAGGWYRPQTDFEQACNDIANELWDLYTSQADRDQAVKDKLIYFLKSRNIIVKNQQQGLYGIFDPPTDYGRYASSRVIYDGNACLPSGEVDGGKCYDGEDEVSQVEEYRDNIQEFKVDLIPNIRWGSVSNHLTKKPTLQNPKITQVDGKFRVLPRTVSVIVLDYYLKPRPAKFAYTIAPANPQTGAGGQIIYNKAESLPLQFPTTVTNDFLVRLGARFGLFTMNQFVSAAANAERQLQNANQ